MLLTLNEVLCVFIVDVLNFSWKIDFATEKFSDFIQMLVDHFDLPDFFHLADFRFFNWLVVSQSFAYAFCENVFIVFDQEFWAEIWAEVLQKFIVGLELVTMGEEVGLELVDVDDVCAEHEVSEFLGVLIWVFLLEELGVKESSGLDFFVFIVQAVFEKAENLRF